MNTRELKMTDSALLRERDRQLAARSARSRRLAPRKAEGREKAAAKRKEERARRGEVRAACAERARGRCEACGDFAGVFLEMDHFWGRARDERVESCWMLCNQCHHEKTENIPTRREWLLTFRLHANGHLYFAEQKRCDNALALEAAQHPGPTARRDGDRND